MSMQVGWMDVCSDMVDFSNLFHWNTKQLFLYVVLEYESNNYGRNQVVFWDKIIRRTDGKRLSITGLKNKYPLVDIDDQLPGTAAIVKMYWNTVPQVGYLFDTQNGSVEVKIPNIGEKFSSN
jgi:signal peptidase complex subunit 3